MSRPTWSMGGIPGNRRPGTWGPLRACPTDLGAARALDPHLRGTAHLLNPQETHGPLSLPCVSGAVKAGPLAPVLSGRLRISLPVQSPHLQIVLRENKRQCQPLAAHPRRPLKDPRSLARFHAWVSSSLLSTPRFLVSATQL